MKRKRTGRPIKEAKGKRAQVTFQIKAEIQRELRKRALAAGHTISREGELWLERLLTYEDVLKGMGKTMQQLDDDAFRAEMRRRGYTPVHGSPDKQWLQLPEGQRSGFIAAEETDQ